jgi:endogenous inhibitor of DNA gyrase (YacG/DUF329 family)
MGRRCPTCKKAVKEGEKYFPFCSERCRWVDLGHWLAEDYKIPASDRPAGAEPPDENDTAPESHDTAPESGGAGGERKVEGPPPRPGGGS